MSCKTRITNGIAMSCATVLMFAASAASAKCKFQTDMPSIVTGEHIRWTDWTTFSLAITTTDYALATGISEGERKYVGLQLHTVTTIPRPASKQDLDNAVVIPAGADVFFLMADESVIKVTTDQAITGDSDFVMHNAKRYDIVTNTIVKAPLTTEELRVLTAQRVKRIRVSTTSGDLDFEFGKKGSKKMQSVLECIQ
ncbi:MAG: hypothetical protein OEM51_09175 [Gammaproteobacteria bacterium]|nr:hypothetical protein [Gammaproteobacteria bacterium]